MENQAVDAVTLAGSVGATDFTLWALFLKADVLVKSVMVVLILASFWCWAIIFEKGIRLRRLRTQAAAWKICSIGSAAAPNILWNCCSSPPCGNGEARPRRVSQAGILCVPGSRTGLYKSCILHWRGRLSV